MSDCLKDVDADSRIRALLQSSSVRFASPVFRGPDEGWLVVTPQIHARVRPVLEIGGFCYGYGIRVE